MTALTARAAGVVAFVAVLAWGGLVWLAFKLYTTTPPTAAFDLELLLRAGRAVAAGQSPYDSAMLAGAAPVAERLFYSYPPVVAQLMSLVAGVPSPVVFVAWSAAAVAGLGLVARALAARYGGSPAPNVVALVTVAFAPLLFPFAIGLLFGNLDVFFPLAFGLVLLGILPRASTSSAIGSGAAASLATVSKLSPAVVGLWLLARSTSTADVRRALAAAAIVLGTVLGLSIAVGGIQPWMDYATVVRAGSGADLVDPRNAGPAAQIALLLGGAPAAAESLARTLQIPVTLGALVATVVAALRVREPVESLAWAVVGSLIVLPVTWYHYPSALIPFAIVAFLRAGALEPVAAQRVRLTIVAAAVVAALAIALLPLLYVAIGLVLAGVRMSRPAPTGLAA